MRSPLAIFTAAAVVVISVTLALPSPASAQATRPARAAAVGEADPKLVLQRKIPELKMTAVPLDDAVDFLRDVTGANIHVNWRALELLNVTRLTPVSLQLRDVSVRRALRGLLDETGSGELLTWYIEDGVIEITTREIADNQMITRVYPVEDLVTEIPNFEGPTFNLQQQNNTTSGQGGGGGGGGQSLLSGNGNTAQQEQPQSRAERADGLVRLITETIRPEVWRDNGGTASIRYFNGHLIVTAPRSIHEAISTTRGR